MKIGIVVDNELNNDKRVLREAQILKDNGHKIFALCFRFDRKDYKDINGIGITRVNISRRLKNTLFLLFNTLPLYERLWSSRISRFIIDNDLDFIHAHDLYMAKCAFTGIRKSGKSVKLILDLHENFAFQITTYNWTKGFLRKIISRPELWENKEKDYLEYADRIIVLSDDFRDHLVSKYPSLKKENFCALPNVPDVEQMNSFKADLSKIPFKKRCPILCYFGIVAERRGIFIALSGFSDLIKEGADLDFLIIGPVDKKDRPLFNKIIGSDELRNRIIYVPWIDLSDLPSYLEISDICIAPFVKNPQHESGVANKIYDYMLGAKPIIASNCIPQQRLIERHKCGLIFENHKELHDAIIRLVEDKELRVRMGKNGYAAVVKEYNTEIVKENLIRMYNSLIL